MSLHCKPVQVQEWEYQKQNNDQREFQAGFASTVILFIESSLSDHDLLRINLKQEVSVCHVCLSEHDLFWINCWNRKS